MECPLNISACGHGISRPYRVLILLALFTAYLIFLYAFLPYPDFLVYIGLAVAYLLPSAGKEPVIPLGICLGEVWWLTALTCALIDSVCALFVIRNFDLLLRVPVFGPAMGRFAGGDALLSGPGRGSGTSRVRGSSCLSCFLCRVRAA